MILNTRALRDVCSPPVFPFHQQQVAKHDSNTLIKFADAPTVVILITKNDETACREEVRDLAVWCQDNNFSPKTKELIVDYRKRRAEQDPINIDGLH